MPARAMPARAMPARACAHGLYSAASSQGPTAGRPGRQGTPFERDHRTGRDSKRTPLDLRLSRRTRTAKNPWRPCARHNGRTQWRLLLARRRLLRVSLSLIPARVPPEPRQTRHTERQQSNYDNLIHTHGSPLSPLTWCCCRSQIPTSTPDQEFSGCDWQVYRDGGARSCR
jgi:hypothetical protein